MKVWAKKHGWRVLIAGLVFAATVAASYSEGTPTKLPGAALEWAFLFHLERAAAVLAAMGVVALVGWRALLGEFPIKFGQVEYPIKQAATRSEEIAEAHEERIRILESLTGVADPPPGA